MCILKTGFLFVASEFGNQYVPFLKKAQQHDKNLTTENSFLYQFQSIGDEEEMAMEQDEEEVPTFNPQPLKNLIEIDEIHSLAPIMDLKVCVF